MPGGEKMVAFTRILHRSLDDEIMDEVAPYNLNIICFCPNKLWHMTFFPSILSKNLIWRHESMVNVFNKWENSHASSSLELSISL